MNAAASNPFAFPKTESSRPKARLVTPKPRNAQGDNVYMKSPPEAYVPYAPANPPATPYGKQRPAAVARDDKMVPLAIIGMALTIVFGIPVGVFTGPSALKRAKKVDYFIEIGKRPRGDATDVSTARVCAWIGIVWSIPLIIIWSFVLVGMLFLIAG